jgi:thioredoxin 1
MSKLFHANDLNFEEVVNSELPVLVDFSAIWCGPCKRMLPILENFAELNSDKVKIVSLDIDESPVTAGKYNVKAVPTLMIFKGGQKIQSKVGLQSQAALEKFVAESL